MSLKAAVITFPGSNCDQDMHRAVRLMGWKLECLWHESRLESPVDVIFLPGGFSYGDYMRAGALARFSPAMESVADQVRRGGLVVGVCNGFQILCDAGYLPGALTRNSGLAFRCIWTNLRVASPDTPFTGALRRGDSLRIPIAHGEGNYQIDADGLKALRDHDQVVFEYLDNPNGSVGGIAGVCNRERTVLGMMPHPERAMEPMLGGAAGRKVFESIEASLSRAGA